MDLLQRLTTDYSETEDRVRLSGATEGGTVTIWLTQRLLLRLLPALFDYLDQRSADSAAPALEQQFAQEAARQQLAPQQPVRAADASPCWVAQEIDVTLLEDGILLQFRANTAQCQARLFLTSTALRQWLNILRDVFVAAQWPLGESPPWWRDGTPTAAAGTAILH